MAKTGTAVAKTDTPEKTPAVVRPAGPLNQTQLKNLREIVDGDFRDLQAEVKNTISQRTSRRIEEIEKQFAVDARKSNKAREEMQAAIRKAEDAVTAALAKQTDKGLAIMGSQPGVTKRWVSVAAPTEFVVAGKDEAIQRVRVASNRLVETAGRVINRKHSEVSRQVLLQGIAADNAVELVNSLPQSGDIMDEVTAAVAVDNADDLKEIGLT